MATIKKRGNGYSVIYSHLNSDGEKKQKWESFSTHAAAKARKITVENDLQEGVFVAPSQLTVSEYLDTFMELYGAKNGHYPVIPVISVYLQIMLFPIWEM